MTSLTDRLRLMKSTDNSLPYSQAFPSRGIKESCTDAGRKRLVIRSIADMRGQSAHVAADEGEDQRGHEDEGE